MGDNRISMEKTVNVHNVRYVIVCGVCYLRVEDVAVLIRELGSTEETDVRNRLNDAASNLASAQNLTNGPSPSGDPIALPCICPDPPFHFSEKCLRHGENIASHFEVK